MDPQSALCPPLTIHMSTRCRSGSLRASHQRDSVIAVEVHPVQSHQREEMSDVERGRRGIYADVCANSFTRQEPVERFARPRSCECHPPCRTSDLPRDVFDEAPLLENIKHAPLRARSYSRGLFFPLRSSSIGIGILGGPSRLGARPRSWQALALNTLLANVRPRAE
jgi:hypothetical protein